MVGTPSCPEGGGCGGGQTKGGQQLSRLGRPVADKAADERWASLDDSGVIGTDTVIDADRRALGSEHGGSPNPARRPPERERRGHDHNNCNRPAPAHHRARIVGARIFTYRTSAASRYSREPSAQLPPAPREIQGFAIGGDAPDRLSTVER